MTWRLMKGIETVLAAEEKAVPRVGAGWAGVMLGEIGWRTESGWKTRGLGGWRRGKESDMC